MCEDLKGVVNDINQQILESSASMYNKEYQEDLLYDFEQARTDIFQWKAHILRSVNQDKAKQNVIRNLKVHLTPQFFFAKTIKLILWSN